MLLLCLLSGDIYAIVVFINKRYLCYCCVYYQVISMLLLCLLSGDIYAIVVFIIR